MPPPFQQLQGPLFSSNLLTTLIVTHTSHNQTENIRCYYVIISFLSRRWRLHTATRYLDWAALSNSSAQFIVGVLARLSKAGIDAFTLQVSRAIDSNFTLTSFTQKSLIDAIHRLKKYGSYDNVL